MRKRDPTKPKRPATPAQSQASRNNGSKNDGHNSLGISNPERAAIKELNKLSAIELTQIKWEKVRDGRDAVRQLAEAGFRLRKELKTGPNAEAAKVLGGIGLHTLAMVATGAAPRGKISAMFKGAVALREEVCDPIVKETKLTGAMTLEQMMVEAGKQARAQAEAERAKLTACAAPVHEASAHDTGNHSECPAPTEEKQE